MPETTQFTYKVHEITALMIKASGVHEGLWNFAIKFGIGGANVQDASGTFLPSAIVPVMELGIQRVDAPTPLSVDAAKVNPAKD